MSRGLGAVEWSRFFSEGGLLPYSSSNIGEKGLKR